MLRNRPKCWGNEFDKKKTCKNCLWHLSCRDAFISQCKTKEDIRT